MFDGFKGFLRALSQSIIFDIIGVFIVVLVAYNSGYLFDKLSDKVNWGAWTVFIPFGIISAINAILSILSTRFTGRVSNIGNILGIINTVLSGTIDYILKNKAAIITYPVTFIIYLFAIKIWTNSEAYKARPTPTGKKAIALFCLVVILATVFSFTINYIGFKKMSAIYYITSVTFALSLISNFLNALKLSVQWRFWIVYNIVQLIKAYMQGNFANVGKYVYYIVNSFAAIATWSFSEKSTDDKEQAVQKASS